MNGIAKKMDKQGEKVKIAKIAGYIRGAWTNKHTHRARKAPVGSEYGSGHGERYG